MNEENKKEFSDVEILDDAIVTLGNLLIPVSLTDELTTPINRVRKNLIVLIQTIQSNREEPQIEIGLVPDDEINEDTMKDAIPIAVEEVGGNAE